MEHIPIEVIQARQNGMVVIPDGYAVVRPNQEQEEYIKQQFPDKPLPHTILVTRVPGNSSSIRGDPELSKPKCRSLSKYESVPSRGTSLSVIRTFLKEQTSAKERTSAKGKGKSKGKGKKRPSDKGETRKGKKAKARKKQGTKKRRKTKRRTQKKSNRVV